MTYQHEEEIIYDRHRASTGHYTTIGMRFADELSRSSFGRSLVDRFGGVHNFIDHNSLH